MSIKIALCHDQEKMMKKVQAVIKIHPQAALFEVSCFFSAEVLLNQSTVYDVLITDIQNVPKEINGFELASEMNEHTKIIILSAYSPNDFSYTMRNYYFELFASMASWDFVKLLKSLDNYLAWREDPHSYAPRIPRRMPPPKCSPPPRPSITLSMGHRAEATLYYDEIFYFYQLPNSLIPQIIITTINGDYKLRARIKQLTQLCKLNQFNPSNDGRYLVNLDYCTLDSAEKNFILTINGKPIKRFKPSPSEYRLAKRYSFYKNGG